MLLLEYLLVFDIFLFNSDIFFEHFIVTSCHTTPSLKVHKIYFWVCFMPESNRFSASICTATLLPGKYGLLSFLCNNLLLFLELLEIVQLVLCHWYFEESGQRTSLLLLFMRGTRGIAFRIIICLAGAAISTIVQWVHDPYLTLNNCPEVAFEASAALSCFLWWYLHIWRHIDIPQNLIIVRYSWDIDYFGTDTKGLSPQRGHG